LLAPQPRINRCVSAEQTLRFVVSAKFGCEELSDCRSFERLNRNALRHEIGELAARRNIDVRAFGEQLKRRDKADEVAERTGKEHADFSCGWHLRVVRERFH